MQEPQQENALIPDGHVNNNPSPFNDQSNGLSIGLLNENVLTNRLSKIRDNYSFSSDEENSNEDCAISDLEEDFDVSRITSHILLSNECLLQEVGLLFLGGVGPILSLINDEFSTFVAMKLT